MTHLIYAIKINDLKTSGLRVLDVKIGKTSNIKRTLKQYRRSGRDIAILDLWEPNRDLTLSQCETGVHYLAERYAYSKESEKFIFLQDKYDEFSSNVSKLLKKASSTRPSPKRVKKKSKLKKKDYTGKKPKYVKFKNKTYDVNTWRDVMRVVVKQIYDEVDDFDKVLELKGQKRPYFAKRKNILAKAKLLPDTPYYFEGKLSANHLMNIINKLFEIFGYDESDLEIRFK